MTARQRFKLYDRVKWTEDALRDRGLARRRQEDRGEVITFSDDDRMIYVKKLENRWCKPYRHELWEKADA
jgi:hypothetical protein